MEREVFVLPAVQAFYDTAFICYRLDAEKGEGPSLATAYGVNAYPTWLYLQPDGTLRSRGTDYMRGEDFIAFGKQALGKNSVAGLLGEYETRFRNGDRDTAFLKKFIVLRNRHQLDNTAVMNAYVAARGNCLADTAELGFMLQHNGRTWTDAVAVILSALKNLHVQQQRQVAHELYSGILYYAAGTAVKAGDHASATKALQAIEQVHSLLTPALQLSADRAALFYYKDARDADGIKKAGYRIAEKQMAIDTIMARRQDKELFDKVMEPFRNGTQDSTRIPGFAEEKKLAMTQYSGGVASLLYEVADAFDKILPAGDAARKDAARWAERARLLVPNEHTTALAGRLSGK